MTREVGNREQLTVLEDYETFEFRSSYLPNHLNADYPDMPRIMWYLWYKGYLTDEYFDWETRTVIK